MEQSAACLLEQSGNDKPRVSAAMGGPSGSPGSFPRTVQIEVFEDLREAFALKAHGRILEKDGKNVLDAITAFKTVGCLYVTFAHAKFGCAILVVGSAPIVVVV
jgi:hypothetical protein